jgi:hypothetical protein
VVLTPEQNKGQVFREFGANMAVLACDPDNPDDMIRLRFVMQVMVLVARNHLPASAGGEGNETASLTDRLVGDLATARRALEGMRAGMDAVTEIEKLAAKTSQNASTLHDRAQALKLSLIAPLDRAREAMESQAQLLGVAAPTAGSDDEAEDADDEE